jgi:cob(I)alamin adenosyltransferase
MKIYTKTGDDGTTGVYGSGRVRKSDPRIECYGTVDELNAALGLAAVDAAEPLASRLRVVQNDLFVMGAYLATPDLQAMSASLPPPLHAAHVQRLEKQVDEAEAVLPPLRTFILPGGTATAARLHLARAVCRRAERQLDAFILTHSVSPSLLIYLNRLGDWLFVQARLANHTAGVPDVQWKKES